ncbi:hypothetical protein LEP1GSC061_2614 [Leptospira wolffii serovar Khorat str. Khorat-H2]|nr:hypothetical protein LEP1GSC061_2614 [Leptospira wolffii serovar Khorat str. Khorat-H2]
MAKEGEGEFPLRLILIRRACRKEKELSFLDRNPRLDSSFLCRVGEKKSCKDKNASKKRIGLRHW